ncbi:MAG: 50S ribosomal protein L23 [Deltaproteobacteria bacterium RBG_19FT_COMBO_46_9]|jgi:large subunit ribosomal protein L23|nr:MAG: 50S ribosomal protein L23 [Deltaproteobacteria bacterium RBG_19FT_COMBO_46_9]
MDTYNVIKEPHVAEKVNMQKELFNQLTFKVDRRANKVEIKKAVERLFKTKVLDVKTLNIKGKKRRVGRNIGKRPDWKKAIVRLAPGEKVEFFEGV